MGLKAWRDRAGRERSVVVTAIEQLLGSLEYDAQPLSTWVTAGECRPGQLELLVDYPLGIPQHRDHHRLLTEAIRCHDQSEELLSFEIKWTQRIACHRACDGKKPLKGISNIIAVMSGKGGVGKSTTAFHLALSLASQGARVGLLDGDIYGPNQAELCNHHKRPVVDGDNKSIAPVERYGIKTMSMGYLVDQKEAVIWRGPMVTSAIMQLVNQTQWGELDYLLIDMPPGTGDLHLTLTQKVPLTAVVLVTTPERLACSDTRKGYAMLEKLSVPALGLVVNMAYLDCGDCHSPQQLYRNNHAVELAETLAVPVLATLPWQPLLQIEPEGEPLPLLQPDHAVSGQLHDAAGMIALRVGRFPREYQQLFDVELSS